MQNPEVKPSDDATRLSEMKDGHKNDAGEIWD